MKAVDIKVDENGEIEEVKQVKDHKFAKKVKKFFIDLLTILIVLVIAVIILAVGSYMFRKELNFTYLEISYDGPEDVITPVYIIKYNGQIFEDYSRQMPEKEIEYIGTADDAGILQVREYVNLLTEDKWGFCTIAVKTPLGYRYIKAEKERAQHIFDLMEININVF